MHIFRLLILLSFLPCALMAMTLRDNFRNAQAGDYLVIAQKKNYTVLLVQKNDSNQLKLEEITVPSHYIPKKGFSWKGWVNQGAPYNTSWIIYRVNLNTGQIIDSYSASQQRWLDVSQGDMFLPTLLNLSFEQIPIQPRRSKGYFQQQWQPFLIYEGQYVPGVPFEAWSTQWPDDGSELAGRTIEIYLPSSQSGYPSYYPYWLQIKGTVTKAHFRVIDSGKQLVSPSAEYRN